MHGIGKWAGVFFGCSMWMFAQNGSAPVRVIVTLGHFYGEQARVLTPEDLTVTQGFGDPMPITRLTPLRGDRGELELFVLVDNCSTCEPGSKFEELKRFIESQPATTKVGIAYIDNGRLKIAENPGADRAKAVKALSVPAGGQAANPFAALTELIRTWPRSTARRAVVMISNGVDPVGADKILDPAAEGAIEAAQRGEVTIYAIYHPSADYVNADFMKLNAGQVQLAHVANESGGEAYFLSFGPLPSLAPFLADIAEHLANQYVLEFKGNPAAGSGELEGVEVKSKRSEFELMAPAKVWVQGRASSR